MLHNSPEIRPNYAMHNRVDPIGGLCLRARTGEQMVLAARKGNEGNFKLYLKMRIQILNGSKFLMWD